MITVYETYDQSDLIIIKGLFEKEKITFHVLYEYRVHFDKQYDFNSYEPALIQVNKKDFLRSNRLLQKQGFKKSDASHRFSTYKVLENITQKIPLLANINGSFRVLIFVSIISILTIGLIFESQY